MPESNRRIEFQTYSNREYVNLIYTQKYEDCIEALLDTIEKSEDGNDLNDFQKRLASLYWSVIAPRRTELSKEDEKFFEQYRPKLLAFYKLTPEEGIEILSEIATYLREFGTLKPEMDSLEPRTALITQFEPRKFYHGKL